MYTTKHILNTEVSSLSPQINTYMEREVLEKNCLENRQTIIKKKLTSKW